MEKIYGQCKNCDRYYEVLHVEDIYCSCCLDEYAKKERICYNVQEMLKNAISDTISVQYIKEEEIVEVKLNYTEKTLRVNVNMDSPKGLLIDVLKRLDEIKILENLNWFYRKGE